MAAENVWASWYIFANGGGIGEVIAGSGTAGEWAVVPENKDVQAWDKAALGRS
jgi:hypothetical protein